MADEELILAMAICDLLGNPKKREEIEKAVGKAYEMFYAPHQSPRPAKKTFAHIRKNQTE